MLRDVSGHRNSRIRLAGVAIAAAAVLAPPGVFAQVQSSIDYDRQVHPVLAAKCLSCHSQEKRSGGLSLATYSDVLEGGRSGAAIQPGRSAVSLILQRILGESAPRMPLGAAPLGDAEIALIRAWIDQGARATPTSAPAKPKWEAPLTLQPSAIPQQ